MFTNHGQSGQDFSTLSKTQQTDFVHWYAKAHLGGLYATQYFNPVIDRWDIPVKSSLAYIKKNGFIGVPLKNTASIDDGLLSKGRVRIVFNNYMLARCNRTDRFLAAREGSELFGALAGTYKITGELCASRMGGPYPYTIFQNVAKISSLSCSGPDTQKQCSFVFKLDCSYQGSENDETAIRYNKLTLGTLCKAIEIPYPARATFARNGPKDWIIVGKVNFGK